MSREVVLDWAACRPVGLALAVSKDGEALPGVTIPPKAVYTFGRNSTMSDVVLDHPSLSRQHAAIAFDAAGDAFLLDLGSTHGTFVNGERLEPRVRRALRGSDAFSFGGSKRTFSLSQSPSAPPAAAIAGDFQSDMGPPPVPPLRGPRALVPAAAAPGPAAQSPQAAADAAAAARAQREAEIRAIRESFAAPPVVRHPQMPRDAVERDSDDAGDAAGRDALLAHYPEPTAADVYDDDDEDEGEKEEADGTAAGVPMAFVSRRVARLDASRAAMAARNESMQGRGDVAAMAATRRAATGDRVALGSGDSAAGDEDSTDGAGAADPAAAAARSLGLPASHEVVLRGHSKLVSCLAFDASGARLLTGSTDYSVRIFDFGSMDREQRAYRDVVPQDGQPVHALGFSSSASHFVVATGSAKATVFDRNGTLVLTTFKGDVYVTDMTHTKGHVSSLTAAQFVPGERDLFITASRDGSVRWWHMEGKQLFDELLTGEVLKVKSARALRAAVTAATLSQDGRALVAASDDGSVQLFNIKAAGHKYVRPDGIAASAHAGGEVTSIAFAPDGQRFATRGTDDCVAIWDVRRFGGRAAPLAVVSGVSTVNPTAGVTWSPDGRLLLAGLAARKGEGDGAVRVFDVPALEARSSADAAAVRSWSGGGLAAFPGAVDAAAAASYTLSVAPGSSVIALAWHDRINQIVAGCADGCSRVLYDPGLSRNGALISAAKAPKRRDTADFARIEGVGHIVSVNALPLFREPIPGLSDSRKRRIGDLKPDTDLRDRQPSDAGLLAKLAKNPALPVADPGYLMQGTRTFTAHYKQLHATGGRSLREEDPSVVLRAFDERAKAAGGILTRAYATSQPAPVLAEETIEADDERNAAEIDRMLGMKAAAKVGRKQ